MKTIVSCMVVCISTGMSLAWPFQPPQTKPDEQEKAKSLMKQKLVFSQNVLAGLTEGDFDKVSSNAKAMNVLSYLEKWKQADMEEYKRQLTYFDMANKELIRHAKQKNIDGATLWYNLLTTSCVQCHTIVRTARK
jgi:hypothetical protein